MSSSMSQYILKHNVSMKSTVVNDISLHVKKYHSCIKNSIVPFKSTIKSFSFSKILWNSVHNKTQLIKTGCKCVREAYREKVPFV